MSIRINTNAATPNNAIAKAFVNAAQAAKAAQYAVYAATAKKANLVAMTDTEAEARAIANASWKAHEGDKIVVRTPDGAVAAVAVRNVTEDPEARYSKMVSQTMPGQAEGRTNLPRCPRWMVSAYLPDGTLTETMVAADEAAAKQLMDGIEKSGLEAVVFHNMTAVACTEVLAGPRRQLAQMPTLHQSAGGLLLDGSVTVAVSPTRRYLNTAKVFKVNAEITDVDEEVRDRKQAAWDRTVRKGEIINGNLYGVYGHGTNAAKDCELKMTLASEIPALRKWQNNGASPDWKVAIAKYFAYNGLMDVGLAQAYPTWLKPDAEIILPTLKTLVEGNIVDAYGDGSLDGPAWKAIEQASSDGQAVISFSEKYVSEVLATLHGKELEEAKRFFCKLRGHSFRMALQKGYATVLKIGAMQSWLKKHGVTVLKDVNGVERDVDDIAIFADETVFKGSFGKDGSHKDWKEYCQNYGLYGHVNDQGMLVISHDVNRAPGMLSAQFWRAMTGTPAEYVLRCWEKEVDLIKRKASTPDGIGELIGGVLGKAVAKKPQLLRIPCFAEQARKALDKMIAEAKRGQFHNISHTLMWSTDVFQWVLKAAGIEKVVIPHGIVIIPGANWIRNGQKVLVTRDPIQNASAVQIRFAYNSFAAAGIEAGELLDEMVPADGTVYTSAQDILDTAVEGDHDGDKLKIIADEDYVAMVEARDIVLARLGFNDVIVKAHTGKAEKELVTPQACQKYLSRLTHRVGVGQPDDLMSKLVGHVPFGEAPTAEQMQASFQVKWAMQDAVDAGKNDKAKERFVDLPTTAAARKAKIPYSQALAKAERRGTELPKERPFGNGTLDTLRVYMNGELENVKISIGKLPELDPEDFQLPNAEKHPALYNFIGRPKYRFFPMNKMGELSETPVTVLHFDTREDAEVSIDDGKFVKSSGDKETWAKYACCHDVDEEKSLVYDIAMKVVDGKWICNEATTPLFSAMESRVRGTYEQMLESEEGRKLAKGFLAEKAHFSKLAIDSYAALFGYTMEDTYNKVVLELFKDRDWLNSFSREWKPNWFTYQWFSTLYGDLFAQAINEEPEDEDAAEYDGDIDDIDVSIE